jgi:DNA-binding protein Fis
VIEHVVRAICTAVAELSIDDRIHALEEARALLSLEQLCGAQDQHKTLTSLPFKTAKQTAIETFKHQYLAQAQTVGTAGGTLLTFKVAKQIAIEIFERYYFSQVLIQTKGSITIASEITGVDRANLRRALIRNNLRLPGEKTVKGLRRVSSRARLVGPVAAIINDD